MQRQNEADPRNHFSELIAENGIMAKPKGRIPNRHGRSFPKTLRRPLKEVYSREVFLLVQHFVKLAFCEVLQTGRKSGFHAPLLNAGFQNRFTLKTSRKKSKHRSVSFAPSGRRRMDNVYYNDRTRCRNRHALTVFDNGLLPWNPH